MADKNKRIEVVLTAVDIGLNSVFAKANKTIAAAEQGAASYGKTMTGLQAPIRALFGTLAQLGAAFGAVFASKKFLETAEAYTNIDARLKLVTGSSEGLAAVQKDLYALSQKTGTSYEKNANLYYKLAVALKAKGATEKELIAINEAVTESLVVNGSTVQETSSFLLQFGQAMGSGLMAGEEFRAMMESNSYFAQNLAKALGTDIAGLREMSKAQELTTDKIRDAIPKMLEQINADFAKMPLTIGRTMTMMENAFGKIVNGSNKAGGATGKIANEIRKFVSYLESNGAQIEKFVVHLTNMAGKIVKMTWEYRNFIAVFAGTTLAVSAVATLTTAIKGLNAAFLIIGKGSLLVTGVVGAAVAAGVAIGLLIRRIQELKKSTLELAAAEALAKSQGDWINPKIAGKLAEINTALQTNFKTMDELFAAEKRGEVSFNEMTGTWVRGAKAQAEAVAASAAKQKQVTAEALAAMKTAYQGYAAEVKRLQGEIISEEKSLDQQLRDMARTGMSDYNAWQDKKKQAEEYAKVAKAAGEAGKLALKNGNADEAAGLFKTQAEYAKMAKEQYSSLATEVKSGDKVIISQAESIKIAMEGVKKTGENSIEGLKLMQEAAHTAMESLTEKSGLQDLSNGMDEAERKWLINWQDMRAGAIKDIEAVEDRLLEIKDREITVWINEKVKKAVGGLVGQAVQFARGGKLSGYGGGDRISALLEAGEFIIRKEAVAKFGSGFFAALNSLQFPALPRLATGGPIGGASAASPAAAANFNITLNYSGPSSRSSAKGMTDMVMGELQKRWRGRS